MVVIISTRIGAAFFCKRRTEYEKENTHEAIKSRIYADKASNLRMSFSMLAGEVVGP
jgi:hypothetical protein